MDPFSKYSFEDKLIEICVDCYKQFLSQYKYIDEKIFGARYRILWV